MRVPVFVDLWQQECCGAAFSVGDEVAWQLVVDHGFRWTALGGAVPDPAMALPVMALPVMALPVLALPVVALLGPASGDRQGALLGAGDLRVFLPADVEPPPGAGLPDPYPVQLVAEDHHVYLTPLVPPTPGRVASIRVVAGRRPADGRVPGAPTLRDTHTVGPARQRERAGLVGIGYLVELDIALP